MVMTVNKTRDEVPREVLVEHAEGHTSEGPYQINKNKNRTQ